MSPKIVLKFYAMYRDAIGVGEKVLKVGNELSVRELLEYLSRVEKLGETMEKYKPVIIVNGEIVGEDYTIRGEAVVEIAPGFSGG